MARVVAVIIEAEIGALGETIRIPKAVLDTLSLLSGDEVEVRLSWEGGVAQAATQVVSGPAIRLTPDSGEVARATPVTVTIWRVEPAPEGATLESGEKGWWAQDGGADFESRIEGTPEPLRSELRGLLDWARELQSAGLALVYSYHNAAQTTSTLLPYLPHHKAGLVTIWNTGMITFARTVFDLFAPEHIERVERLIGKPLRQRTSAAQVTGDLLAAIRDAYVSAAKMPPVGVWTNQRFDAVFRSALGSTKIVDTLRTWSQQRGISLRYGGGPSQGPLNFVVEGTNAVMTLFSLNAGGSILINVRGGLDAAPAFASAERRRQLLTDLTSICGVRRSEGSADTWFTLPLRRVEGELLGELVVVLTGLHEAVSGEGAY